MTTELIILLPRLIQYLCAAATLIFLVQSWRVTRHAGFAVLALVLLAGYAQILMVPFLSGTVHAVSLGIIFGIDAAIMSLLTALAWWRIHLWLKRSNPARR